MNKGDLAAAVAEKTGMTKKASTEAIDALFATITEALAKKEKVQIIGFGTFETRERSERTGRNPSTGAEMKIPASTAPAFKAGKALKDAVNG